MSSAIELERKADAHEKIQLGGLVVKAGLRECDAAILLGAMIEAAEALEKADTKKVSRWREIGKNAFGVDAKKKMERGQKDV